MIKENKEFYDFPLDKIKHNWPFDKEMAKELFWSNEFQQYSSLYDFIFDNIIDILGDSVIVFSGFFIENNELYYEGLDDKKYTLKNVPYSLIIYSAIKHELNPSSKTSTSFPTYKWSTIFNYLLFTTFPVRQILEESDFMRSDKQNIFNGFSQGFVQFQRSYKLKHFFSKKDCKDRLLYILLYSEISRVEGIALVEKSFLTQDLSDIVSYYRKLSSN